MLDKRRRGAASKIVVVLILIMGIGGFNYYRNFTAERTTQGPRPFEGYSTPDLAKLRDAYAAELAQYERQYASQQRQRRRSRQSGATIGEQVDRFERVQETSNRLREINTDLADHQARLRAVEKEIGYRDVLGGGLALHLKRLTTI